MPDTYDCWLQWKLDKLDEEYWINIENGMIFEDGEWIAKEDFYHTDDDSSTDSDYSSYDTDDYTD